MSDPEWTERARDQLADIWVAATPDERDEIERVVIAAERELKRGPLAVGESRSGRLRTLLRPPLTFWYAVLPPDNRVRIVRVLRPRRHSP